MWFKYTLISFFVCFMLCIFSKNIDFLSVKISYNNIYFFINNFKILTRLIACFFIDFGDVPSSAFQFCFLILH